jgi:hypothetical protein
MGRVCDESYAVFLESLKDAGVAITNETELRERLAETNLWRFAFMTLARNGKALGISFLNGGSSPNLEKVRRAFVSCQFPANADTIFTSSLQKPERIFVSIAQSDRHYWNKKARNFRAFFV